MPDIKHFDPDAVLDKVVQLFWRQGVASTGVQDVVTATGLNRSSLYATFGGKQELYLAALRRYAETRSRPAFRCLAEDGCGLPAVAEFFAGLIEARCSGPCARWGCMVTNAHAGAENATLEVRHLLDLHHDQLRDALHAALVAAKAQGQLGPDTDLGTAAELLAVLAYGVNLRSRAGADALTLRSTVAAAWRRSETGPPETDRPRRRGQAQTRAPRLIAQARAPHCTACGPSGRVRRATPTSTGSAPVTNSRQAAPNPLPTPTVQAGIRASRAPGHQAADSDVASSTLPPCQKATWSLILLASGLGCG